MAGHSKWNNIKRKKEKTDAQKGKIFTKIGREISVAVRENGADPAANSKLRELILKAKSNNVPNENIERVIKKASSGEDKNNYENITYEGYGPNGIAIIVQTLTDNRNRTAADMRHYFDKYGGNLGTSGCVSFMFSAKGVLVFEQQNPDQDKILEDVLEAGGDDVIFEDEIITIYTTPAAFSDVCIKLENTGYSFISQGIEQIPSSYTYLDDEESQIKMQKLLDALENNDDVLSVEHNAGVKR